jgi:hypothetical protein
MLRHPATANSLMQGLKTGCIDTSSDRSINQLTYNPFLSSSVVHVMNTAKVRIRMID